MMSPTPKPTSTLSTTRTYRVEWEIASRPWSASTAAVRSRPTPQSPMSYEQLEMLHRSSQISLPRRSLQSSGHSVWNRCGLAEARTSHPSALVAGGGTWHSSQGTLGSIV